MGLKINMGTVGGYLNLITGNAICVPCLKKGKRSGEFDQQFIDDNMVELTLQESQKFDCVICEQNLRFSYEKQEVPSGEKEGEHEVGQSDGD